MSIRWKLFRVVCILQMMAAAFIIITSLISFFENALFSSFTRIFLFLLIISFTILAVSILNNNYPDVPVAGKQKRSFNILFLLNFLFLTFLFGFIIAEFRSVKQLTDSTGLSIFRFPLSLWLPLAIYTIVLIFQLVILYGMYLLRRELYSNFMRRKFEFEESNS